MQEIQDGNAGNLGDIAKHAALVLYLRQIASLYQGKAIHYLETHCYKAYTRLANNNWLQDVNSLSHHAPGLQYYADMQRAQVRSGYYWCSSALARQILPGAYFSLAESNPQIYTHLAKYHARSKPRTVLVREAHHLPTCNPPVSMTFLHVDPYRMDERMLAHSNTLINALSGAGKPFCIMLFDYEKQADGILRRLNTSLPGIKYHWCRQPYYLLCAMHPALKGVGDKLCEQLTWKPANSNL